MKFEIFNDTVKKEDKKMVFRLDTSDMDVNLQVMTPEGNWKTLLWIDHHDFILRVCGTCDPIKPEILVEMANGSRRQKHKDIRANKGVDLTDYLLLGAPTWKLWL